MTAGCVRRTLLALLLSGIAANALAGGLERYRVMLALQPGDDIQVITSQLAGTYRLRLQPADGTQPSTMIVVASKASVEMLRRDGRVAGIERIAESSAVPGFGAFSYDGAGNITAVGDDKFIYDNFGRLKKATLGANTEEYTYDRYGNLETVTTGGVTKTLGVQASSNRMNQATADLYATYDARGNVTQTSAGATFAYDGTDMVKASTFDGADHLYLYTAGDERIGTITSVNGNIVRSDWTVRDPSGKVLRRFAKSQSGTWTWEEDYIYRDGQLLAAEVPRPEKTLHFHLDHLGTPRVITGNGGAQIAQHTYYPFGTELTSPAQDPEAMKFTGHERDAAALDYMHARYYNSVMGRFLSVDPGKDSDPHKPQSWNMYTYVRNNPINMVDPTGKWGWSDFKAWVRDAREDISNWWHEKWHKDIPAPADQYDAVAAGEAADLSPEEAQQLGNPQARWANARAEAGAIVSDQATEEVMSWGVGKAIGVAGVVVFGHGARHLIGTALEKEAVETAIEKEIQFVSKEASQTGSFWGRVTVNGQVIEYRAFTLPDGTINVGTYYTPKP